MEQQFDVIILGCGASGTMAAISTDKDKRIAIVDAMSFPAKKLLVTGNGRCNLSNVKLSSSFYNQNLDKYFDRFDNAETISFFEKLGLLIHIDSENRVYPFSNTAKTVTDVLFNEIKKRNIFLFCEQTFQKLIKMGDMFCIKTSDCTLYAPKIVVAMGGNSAEQIISDYNIKSKPFVPSLCALKTQSTKRLSGLKLSDVKVTAICDKQTKEQMGEVLFKDSGLSGIVVFNLSSIFARQNSASGKIIIDIMPEITEQDVYDLLTERTKMGGTAKDLLTGMFHHEINKELLWRNAIEEEQPCEEISPEKLFALAHTIKNLEYDVQGFYDNNQVYSGGVLLSELDENLQSIAYPGLYFCGEVCDVDGECGGYNLQWAWTSGHIVGENL